MSNIPERVFVSFLADLVEHDRLVEKMGEFVNVDGFKVNRDESMGRLLRWMRIPASEEHRDDRPVYCDDWVYEELSEQLDRAHTRTQIEEAFASWLAWVRLEAIALQKERG